MTRDIGPIGMDDKPAKIVSGEAQGLRGRVQPAALREIAQGGEAAIRQHVTVEGYPWWQRELLAGIKRGDRWAMRLYAEIAKLVGVQPQIAVQFFQTLGVSDEAQARRMIAVAREAEEAPPAQIADAACRVLASYVQDHPDERVRLLEAAFGVREAR